MGASTADVERGILALRADPALFVSDFLGVNLLPFQVRVLESVRDNRLTAVSTAPNVGKTLTAACGVLWYWALYPGARVITTAPTAHHVEKMLWAEIGKRHRMAKRPLGGRLLTTRLERPGEDWMAYGLSTNEPAAFGGSHKEHQLVVFDDAHGVDPTIWEIALDNLMSGEHCRFLAIGNPLPGAVMNFRRAFRPGSGFVCHYMSRLDHPNVIERRAVIPGAVTHLQVDEIREKHGEDSFEWATNVKGEWADGAEDVLVPVTWLEIAAEAKFTIDEPPHMGVDVATTGADKTVLTITKDRRVAHQESFREPDQTLIAGNVMRLAKAHGVAPHRVHVDVGGGYGGGVADVCGSRNFVVDRVNFGESPVGDWVDTIGPVKFKNRKAELHWVARELIRRQHAAIAERYSETWQDLSAPTFKRNEKDEIIIESKDAVKAKIGRSPDYGDSYVLSLSRAGNNVGVRWL